MQRPKHRTESVVPAAFARLIGFEASALWDEFLVSAVYQGRALATVLGLCVSSSPEEVIKIGLDWVGLWSAVGAEGRLSRTTVADDVVGGMEIYDCKCNY
ncbi:hypothetical protein BJ138DRAFT_1121701 [Hygrophoropsis aurantiaca]|uniref:Uncharacterized protein n=1 Tax=Hygrophoropsis aurantiaca TaxID=72124 RepID=A0ACB8AUX8_9AGAM|nr:hypothetical protein BJ138DRAFT_1121701 [Hygrophoropsis aurantiaca]